MTIFDMDDILSSLSAMPSGFRAFLSSKATEFRLVGFIQRTQSKHARVVIEGVQSDIALFLDILHQMSRENYISAVTLNSSIAIEAPFYRDFKVLKNISRACTRGHRSPADYECTSSVSSTDQEASFERPRG